MSSQPAPAQPSKSNALPLILLLLILAGAAFAGWWFFLRGGGGAAPALLSRAIPAEAKAVIGIDPQAILKSGVVTEALGKTGMTMDTVKAKLAEAKIDLDSFQSVVIGLNPDDQSGVLATQGKMDVAALKGLVLAASAANPQVAELANSIQFEGLDGGLVLAGRGDVYTKALAVAKGQSQGALDPKIAQAAAAVDMGAAIWAAGAIPADAPLGEDMVKSQLGGVPTHAAISIDAKDRLYVKIGLLIPGADASKAAANIKAALGMLPEAMLPAGAGDVVKSVELGGSGEVLTASVSIGLDLLEKLGPLMR